MAPTTSTRDRVRCCPRLSQSSVSRLRAVVAAGWVVPQNPPAAITQMPTTRGTHLTHTATRLAGE